MESKAAGVERDSAGPDSSGVVRIVPQAAGEQPTEPRADEAYCRSCGRIIKREAVMCVHCGVPTRAGGAGVGNVRYAGGTPGTGEGKSKAASIVLAVCLGIFTWLYTYREDGAKFWISVGVTFANIILSVLTLGLWLFVAVPAGFGIWIWTIVDTATKKEDWYASY